MDDMNNENDNDIIGYLARDLTTDSVLSEGSVSRESIASISNKLINMELELDQTLRDLDTTNHQSRSKSPAASKRQQTRQSGRSNFRRRSGSIDPLASSRRSGSIDPGNAADNANKIREMSERLESLEKENHLLETKYDQQRKRLNLAKRENDDLRSTLDSAISEIDKLGEEAQAAHNNGDSNGKLTQETQETIKELQLALTDAHTEITQLRIQKSRTSKSSSRSNNNSSTNLLEFPSLDDTTGPTLAIENQDSSNVSLPPPPPPPIPIPNMMSELGCSLMITVTELNHLEFLGIDSIENDISFKISYGNENRYSKKISLFDSSSSSSDTLGLSALIQEITPHMFALIHDHGETPIKLEIMHSDDVIGEVTLTLPELKLEDMNLCLELEEYLPLTSTLFQPPPPSSSSLTLTSSSNRSFIKLSLCMMNFKKLPRHFSELESYRKNLSEISLLAKNETCSKTCIDVITKAIQSMNIEMEQNKIKIDEYEKKQQQQQPEEEEDSTKGEEDSTAGVFSPGSSTSTLSSIAHFQGEVPTTPLLIGAEEDNNSHSMIKSGGGGEGSNMVEQMSFSSSALRDQTIHEEDSVSSHDLSPTFPRKTTSVAVVSQSCQTTSIEPNLSPPSKTTVTSVATDPMPPVHGVDVATSTPAMKTSTPVPSSSSTATATSSTPSSTKEQVIEYIIEQPLHAFVIVLVIILILWNGSSNIIHNAQMERMESKYALIKSDYLNSCDILGEEMMIKHNGVNSGSDNRLTLSNTISNLNINYQNCTSNIKLYENISLNYDTCTSELLNEKEISEQLLLEINKNNKYNSNHQNNEEDDEDGSGGWFFSKTSNKINENENMITLQDKKEDEDNDDDENALNGKSSIQTIAALYRCRKENHELNEIKVNSLISLESSTQSLHQCQQELSRISTAHISSNNEYSTCEESLLKQQTWSASLSATNNVLHSQLKDSNLLYNKCSNDLIINKEESLKHQSLIKTINLARNISNNKILKLEEINIKLENSTATLNASSQVLQSQLLLLTQENDNLIDKTTNLTSQLEVTTHDRDVLEKEKLEMQNKLKAMTAKSKELEHSLRAGESKYRAMVVLEASQQAGRAVLEKKVDTVTSEVLSASEEMEQVALRNSELASQLSLVETAQVTLQKELSMKTSRLLELEQAMAALSAAEHVVSSDYLVKGNNNGGDGKMISTCTQNSDGSTDHLCLTVQSTGGHANGRNPLNRAANVAANIARSAGISNAWTTLQNDATGDGDVVTGKENGGVTGSGDKGEAPGLVAIAGAVAAVWVFAVVMEKRSSLYKK